MTKGLKEDGAVIINTEHTKDELMRHLNGYKGNVYTVDARGISTRALGKNYPNSPMLAAAVAVSGVMDEDEFLTEMKSSFEHCKETRGHRREYARS